MNQAQQANNPIHFTIHFLLREFQYVFIEMSCLHRWFIEDIIKLSISRIYSESLSEFQTLFRKLPFLSTKYFSRQHPWTLSDKETQKSDHSSCSGILLSALFLQSFLQRNECMVPIFKCWDVTYFTGYDSLTCSNWSVVCQTPDDLMFRKYGFLIYKYTNSHIPVHTFTDGRGES